MYQVVRFDEHTGWTDDGCWGGENASNVTEAEGRRLCAQLAQLSPDTRWGIAPYDDDDDIDYEASESVCEPTVDHWAEVTS